MSGNNLSEAREVTHELSDQRPLSDEGGEMQEVIFIREEVGNDGAINVETGVQAGTGEAAGVGEPGCSMGVEGDKEGEALPSEVTQNLEGEALWALASGCADHGEGIAVGWAQPGEHAAASPGITHGLASVLVNVRCQRDLRC
ncbi:unnamed protein product [Ilex paraguariensis]